MRLCECIYITFRSLRSNSFRSVWFVCIFFIRTSRFFLLLFADYAFVIVRCTFHLNGLVACNVTTSCSSSSDCFVSIFLLLRSFVLSLLSMCVFFVGIGTEITLSYVRDAFVCNQCVYSVGFVKCIDYCCLLHLL